MADLKLGDPVKVSEKCRYYHDWRGWEGFVVGLRATARTGDLSVDVSENWPPKDERDYTDGFTPDDLEPR